MNLLTRLNFFQVILIGVLFLSSCEKNKNSGLPTDGDGNEYDTVVIGTQTWLKENLKTTSYNYGDPIYLITENDKWVKWHIGAYCWYNNDIKYKDTYGALYNWNAAKSQALCPVGWHVPTNEEWTTLIDFLGGDWDAGCKLKESGAIHWTTFNKGTNESGFTALPGGLRYFGDGTFQRIREIGSFWVSDVIHKNYLGHDYCLAGTVDWFREEGLSVRCVKDK